MAVKRGKIRKIVGGNNRRRAKVGLGWRVKEFVVRAARTLFIVIIAMTAFYAGSKVYAELLTTPYLRIMSIEVAGTGRLTEDEVVELSGILRGRNILSVDLKRARGILESHPFIKGARLARRLPDGVSIVIQEREPVAFVLAGALFVMDDDGDVFKEYRSEDKLDLPVVTNMAELETDGYGTMMAVLKPEYAEELLGLIGELSGGGGFWAARVSELSHDPVYGYSLVTLTHGVRVEFGRGSFSSKVKDLEKVVRARGANLAGVEAIDLTGSRGVIVRFTGGGVKGSV